MGSNLYILKLGGAVTGSSKEEGILYNLCDTVKILQERGKKVIIVGSAFKGERGDVTDLLEGREGYDGLSKKFYEIHRRYAEEYGVWDNTLDFCLLKLTDEVEESLSQLVKINNYLKERHAEPFLGSYPFEVLAGIGNQIYANIDSGAGVLDQVALDLAIEDRLRNQISTLTGPVSYYFAVLKHREILDRLLSSGEGPAMLLIERIFHNYGIKTHFFRYNDFGLITNRDFGNAYPLDDVSRPLVRAALIPSLDKNEVVILPGYTGVTFRGIEEFLRNNNPTSVEIKNGATQKLIERVNDELRIKNNVLTTTLGRGGTELTTACIQNYLGGIAFWLKKEVGGVHTADPRIVMDKTRVIRSIDYLLAEECAGVQKRAMRYLAGKNLEVQVVGVEDFCRLVNKESVENRTTIKSLPGKGPLLANRSSTYTISGYPNLMTIRITGVEDKPGQLGIIHSVLGDYGFNIVAQSSDPSDNFIMVQGKRERLELAIRALEQRGFNKENRVTFYVGEGSYISLVSKEITQMDRRELRRVIGAIVKDYVVGLWNKGAHLTWCAVPNEHYESTIQALHLNFVEKPKSSRG